MARNGIGYYPTVDVTAVIGNGWWDEKKFFNYDTLGCEIDQLCGHYTQVIVSRKH